MEQFGFGGLIVALTACGGGGGFGRVCCDVMHKERKRNLFDEIFGITSCVEVFYLLVIFLRQGCLRHDIWVWLTKFWKKVIFGECAGFN